MFSKRLRLLGQLCGLLLFRFRLGDEFVALLGDQCRLCEQGIGFGLGLRLLALQDEDAILGDLDLLF